MKKIIFTLLIIHFSILIVYAQTGWFTQNSGTSGNLRSVYFIDANTGFASGEVSPSQTLILRTTNEGVLWESQSPASPTGKFLRSILFTDANTGFTCGTDDGNYGVGSGIIFKTTNTGINWAVNFSDITMGYTAMNFVNTSTGYVVGLYKNSTSPLLKTTNGGQTWSVTASISLSRMFSVYFYDAQTGWAAGESGAIIKTTNGGVNWITQTSGTTSLLTSIQFINANTGYVVGMDSRVYKTTNGGTAWIVYYNQSLCGIYSVRFANEQTGWVCGCEGAINGTTNNGTSWTLQSFATTTYLYSMSFVSPTTGWAVGAGGRILKTTTGGLTGINQISSEIPKSFSLSQNYPNPFNPSTKIRFEISGSSVAQTFLSVYDILGKEVATLVNEQLKPGSYEIEWNAANFPSGVYYYKLTAGDFIETKKLVLIK